MEDFFLDGLLFLVEELGILHLVVGHHFKATVAFILLLMQHVLVLISSVDSIL